MSTVPLLEAPPAGVIWTAVFCTIIGLRCLYLGWVAYTEPIPHFVVNYTGWSCPPLALLYGGLVMLILGIFAPVAEMDELEAAIPDLILGVIGLTFRFCLVTSLLGFFVWLPFFLVPPWYRRARRAGVPRNDLYAMAAFKALPVKHQKAAARKGKRR